MNKEADVPYTSCDVCRRAEMTRWQYLLYQLRQRWAVPTAAQILSDQARWTSTMIAVATGQPACSPYEQHRAEYERTGDPIELDRMLRHVEVERH